MSDISFSQNSNNVDLEITAERGRCDSQSMTYSGSEVVNLQTSIGGSIPPEGEYDSVNIEARDMDLYSDEVNGEKGRRELNPIFFHAIFSQFQSRCAWNIGHKLKHICSNTETVSLKFYSMFFFGSKVIYYTGVYTPI